MREDGFSNSSRLLGNFEWPRPLSFLNRLNLGGLVWVTRHARGSIELHLYINYDICSGKINREKPVRYSPHYTPSFLSHKIISVVSLHNGHLECNPMVWSQPNTHMNTRYKCRFLSNYIKITIMLVGDRATYRAAEFSKHLQMVQFFLFAARRVS